MPQAAERKALEKGLHKLNENMVTLAELAELSIRKAVDGLTRLDPEVAQEVFTLDQEVYGLQLEIERTCIDLLALHAPVARDLRTITTSFKDIVRRMTEGKLNVETGARYLLVNRYFERIADHAVNIGLRVVYMVTGDWLPRVRAADRAKRRDDGSAKPTP